MTNQKNTIPSSIALYCALITLSSGVSVTLSFMHGDYQGLIDLTKSQQGGK